MADSGIDLENPSPLHVFVGLLTSLTTTFFCIAINYKQMIWAELGFGLARTENVQDTSVHQLSWGWRFQFRFINILYRPKQLNYISTSIIQSKYLKTIHFHIFPALNRFFAAVRQFTNHSIKATRCQRIHEIIVAIVFMLKKISGSTKRQL